MCGLVGILSRSEVAPLMVNALTRLEYRGYDSAGIATIDSDGRLERRRAVGKLSRLSDLLVQQPLSGKSGVGHTRWATHGPPTVENCHPQRAGPVAVVHNGIIENYRELRALLVEEGYEPRSETDTEIIALLAHRLIKRGASVDQALKETVRQLEGAFGIVFLIEGEKDVLFAARKGSPIAIGVGDGEMFVGSDAIALAPLTDRIVYLEEGDFACVTRSGHLIEDALGHYVNRPTRIVTIETEDEPNDRDTTETVGSNSDQKYFKAEEVQKIANSSSASIYLSLIVLEEQIGVFIERVRGSNALEPSLKDTYLSFLVQHQQNILVLASSLPNAGGKFQSEEAETTTSYLDRYWEHLKCNAEDFLSPQRTAGLTLPLGVVALSTSIGSIFGQPIVGTILGAWLAGKVSPEKVVGTLTGPNEEEISVGPDDSSNS